MEIDVLQKNDPFPQMVSKMCSVLAGWKNRYGTKYNHISDTNDRIASTTMTWSITWTN